MRETDRLSVSVVMAVSAEDIAYLPLAVDSVLDQTYRSFEFIIVCDDPESQALVDLLFRFARRDSRIAIHVNETHVGFSISINKAISVAKGKYVLRMDADDIALTTRIRSQVEYLQSNADVGISGMQAEVIDECGRVVGAKRKPCSSELVKDYIRLACPVIHPTYIVRREIYDLLDGYKEFSPGQDYDFLIRAHLAGVEITNQDEVGIRYRLKSRSLSNAQVWRTLRITRELRKSVRKRRVPETELMKQISLREHRPRFLSWVCRARNTFLMESGRSSGLESKCYAVAAVVVSLLHWELALDSWYAHRAASILACGRARAKH